jgi:hypothetical protein
MNIAGCATGKVSHRTRREAKAYLKRLTPGGSRRLHVFRCETCGKWHIGSVTMAELTELRRRDG